jgi:hypothetical protein
VKRVKTKDDFRGAVKEANGLEKQYGKVGEVDVFSHAGLDGPTLHEQNGKPTQFSGQELGDLKVNWATGAEARFYGCYTSWFAQDFANP